MIRSHNVLFGLGKGFCENYNHNHNKNNANNANNVTAQREYTDYMMYPSIYNNLMVTSANAFYNNFKESFMPYNYSFGAFVNNQQFNGYGNVLQNLVNDINIQSLNLQQIYTPNARNGKMNMKK